MRLRRLEEDLLEKAWKDLESEKQRLVGTETVKGYLNPLSEDTRVEEDFS